MVGRTKTVGVRGVNDTRSGATHLGERGIQDIRPGDGPRRLFAGVPTMVGRTKTVGVRGVTDTSPGDGPREGPMAAVGTAPVH